MFDVVVVGAGPAGMMAAITAAEHGAKVLLLEKTERVGKKLMITGKGRCNLTNIASSADIIKNIPGNGAFLNSSLRAFTNEAVIEFFNELGVATKVERGGRVFPLSDKASEVTEALLQKMSDLGIKLKTKVAIKAVSVQKEKSFQVETETGETFAARAVIIATGGASYPLTGSTGDGYKIASMLGHSIVSPLPALIPLESDEQWVKNAQGLSLRNVKATLLINGKKEDEEFGEMLFTHFGISGPIILSLSRKAAQAIAENEYVEIDINLKPALTPETIDNRLVRELENALNKNIKNVMRKLLPEKLIEPVLDFAYIEGDKKSNEITKKERMRIGEVLRHLIVPITKTRPLKEAIVTAGGVSVKEINPKTMESKIIPGLYFAGEVVDVDGYTGGYNLQAAFSMGVAAGKWSAKNIGE